MLLYFNLCTDPAAMGAHFGGTPAYMPPEQLLILSKRVAVDRLPLDERSDLFSLGVILYTLLTGQHPFGLTGEQKVTKELLESLLAHQRRGAVPIRQRNPRV